MLTPFILLKCFLWRVAASAEIQQVKLSITRANIVWRFGKSKETLLLKTWQPPNKVIHNHTGSPSIISRQGERRQRQQSSEGWNRTLNTEFQGIPFTDSKRHSNRIQLNAPPPYLSQHSSRSSHSQRHAARWLLSPFRSRYSQQQRVSSVSGPWGFLLPGFVMFASLAASRLPARLCSASKRKEREEHTFGSCKDKGTRVELPG